jgi:rhamnosyltransferase
MVAAIVVLYYPDLPLLRRLLESVAGQVDKIIAVDNTPNPTLSTTALLEGLGNPVSYIPLGENRGIAEAQNIGIEESIKGGYSHVLLLDQDSAPHPGMVDRLLAAEEDLLLNGERIAAMSPQIVDGRTGRRPCACRYRWLRARLVFRGIDSREPVQTDNFIASGSLIRTSILQVLGMMRSDLFIDHVDTEWALRGRAAGYTSYSVPDAVLMHSIGDATSRILGKLIYLHSDVRHYYQLRNELYLARVKTMGWQWRAYILPRIPYHFILYLVLSTKRLGASRLLLKALWDGMLGRLGPLTQAPSLPHEQALETAQRVPEK